MKILQVKISPRQREFVEVLLELTKELGHPPTYTELSDRMGLCRGWVQQIASRAQDLGLVEWEFNKNRSMRVTALGLVMLKEGAR